MNEDVVVRRPRWITVAAILLAFEGIIWLFYGAFVPLLPPWIDTPVPPASYALGVSGLIAAFGVARGTGWGRRLGIVVVVVDFAYALVATAYVLGITSPARPGTAPATALLELLVPFAIDGVVLFVLLRRWDERGY